MCSIETSFHDEYAHYGKNVIQIFTHSVVHKKDAPRFVKSVSDLATQRVIVHRGGITQHLMTQKGWEKNVIPYDDIQEALQYVHNTEGNQIVANTLSMKWLIHKFQYDELNNARLTEGEQEELEKQSETMEHAEDIKSALYEADNALNGDELGAVNMVRKAMQSLQGISKVLPNASELAERLNSCHIELKDIADEVESSLEDVDFDPAELDRINQRLDQLYDLEKKYHAETVSELIVLRDELKQKLNAIENSDEVLAELEAKCELLKKEAQKQADALTKVRQQAAKTIENQLRQRLVPLGMPNVRFEVNVSKCELGKSGQDNVCFLFSANTSTPLQPVAQVASGGEIARVMLSLKAMISGAVKLPTIIFDEIDTGVSGKIAEKMAEMMQEMGHMERQVISITHLPQIAALGSYHYRVSKEETAQGTTSRMVQLSQDERIGEIAQMLSGSDISDAAIQNAKQLLKVKK